MDKLTWERHIFAFKASKLSARASANQHELIYHRFRYWRRQFSQSNDSRPDFVPVTLAAKPVGGKFVI